MTPIELIELAMSPDQLRIMRELWDTLRWSEFKAMSEVKSDLEKSAIEVVKQLAKSATPSIITQARGLGASILWLEEMERRS